MASKILLYITLITCFAACGGSSSGGGTTAGSLVWKEQQSFVSHKIDILWVLDSSADMAPTQVDIASSMDAVFAKMISLRMDFKMAAITMDMQSNVQSSEGRLIGNPKILDLDTSNLQESFSRLVQPNLNASAEVKAFDALHTSFVYQGLDGVHSMLREDALLVLIFVSDKPDYSSINFQQMQDTLSRYKPSFNKQSWVAHVLTSGCGLSASTKLEQLSLGSDGVSIDLCAGMEVALGKIRERSLELATEISLSENVDPTTLKVLVNGFEIANRSEDGWLYLPHSHSIRFFGTAQPAADAIVKVLTSRQR